MRSSILKLRGDNFTDPSRTPWGGDRVASWKRERGIPAREPLGESWEVSFGPELPSSVEGDVERDVEGDVGRSLLATVQEDPAFYLGEEAALGTSCLLVKLLDARAPLSVQIHPGDRDATLRAGESGKPECWYVAAAEPGAGILFGLSERATPERMRRALEAGADLVPLLTRVAVNVGDFFVVPPGTPHAIGAGVTVVEPQHITPNKRGVTYRYWDWNRRYDPTGQLDPLGLPRALQVEAALAVTDWEGGRGALLKERAFRHAPHAEGHALQLLPLSGPGGIPFSVAVQRLAGRGELALEPGPAARSLTVIDGAIRAESAEGAFVAHRGESLLLAAGARVALSARGGVALIASTPPDRS